MQRTVTEFNFLYSLVDVDIDFGTFLTILTRPDGFKPAGTSQEFIQGFQVFDKEGDGYISAGELRYGLYRSIVHIQV